MTTFKKLSNLLKKVLLSKPRFRSRTFLFLHKYFYKQHTSNSSAVRHFLLFIIFNLILNAFVFGQDKGKKIIVQTEKDKLEAQLILDDKTARAALSDAIKLNNKQSIIQAHQSISSINLKLDKPDTAVVHLLAAIKLTDKINNNSAQRASLFAELGTVFLNENLYKNAIPYYDSALIYQPNNLEVIEKRGDAFLLDGRLLPAERAYQPLIDKLSGDGNMFRVVEIYQKLAQASNRLNSPKKGIEYYLLIHGIVERIGSAEEKARLYNNLGYQYYLIGDYNGALNYLQQAKAISIQFKCANPEIPLINLGIVQHNLKDNKAGIQNLLTALKYLTDRKDFTTVANVEHIIAQTYFGANDFYNALSHNNLAIKYARENKQHDVWRNASKTAAEIYLELYDHENAIEYYRDYLKLDDSLRMVDRNIERTVLNKQTLLERTEKNTQLLIRENTIQELYQDRIKREQDNLRLANSELTLLAKQKQDSVLLLQKEQDLSLKQNEINENAINQKTLELLQLNKLRISEAKQRASEKELFEINQKTELERTQQLAKDSLAAHNLERLQQQAEISNLKLEKQGNFRKFAIGLGVVAMLILGMLAAGWFFARKTSRRLAVQKNLIERERTKSDGLLRNILPDEIAAELKQNGFAKPRQYEQVTVLFTDFVNFTNLSQKLTPTELIDELNECFQAFDLIADKHNLEKIKTIGDAFMCAGGVPVPNESNPVNAVAAALEMYEWLKNRPNEKVFREMRIGIHTGQVIAGVVGKNKFAYDIWGDAVNLAARLEEFGEPGQINISGATFELVSDYYECIYRGKNEVRNKGFVDMYFVKQG